MSASEKVLWGYLRKDQLGFRFRRQYPVAYYFLDFYCPEASLCVEVDGELHELRLDRDAQRDATLRDLGIFTYRLPSLELFEGNTAGICRHLMAIKGLCESRTGRKGNDLF